MALASGSALERHGAQARHAVVRCAWATDGGAFACHLASLAAGGGHRLDIEIHTGERAGPLSAAEVGDAISHGAGAALVITAPDHGDPWARLHFPHVTDVELRLASGNDGMWWLQASLDAPGKPLLLGLPTSAGALAADGVHGVIGLARGFGLTTAELVVGGSTKEPDIIYIHIFVSL